MENVCLTVFVVFHPIQLALQKHVNGHFNATENSKDAKDRRSTDPTMPKKLRVSGKKLRYRRQPFSGEYQSRIIPNQSTRILIRSPNVCSTARIFDFFDTGVMEVLQHRLAVTEATACGDRGAVVFVGQPQARRVRHNGCIEHLVRWSPPDM